MGETHVVVPGGSTKNTRAQARKTSDPLLSEMLGAMLICKVVSGWCKLTCSLLTFGKQDDQEEIICSYIKELNTENKRLYKDT